MFTIAESTLADISLKRIGTVINFYMPDKFSKDKRSKIMASIHSKDTTPELLLRKALWANGLRYRKQYGPKKIDIAFPSSKVAVFVDGCFWHGCPIHSHMPKSNQTYWQPKLKKNIVRDAATNSSLTADGWIVLRIWEHELEDLESVVKKVKDKLALRNLVD
jgi:DNA mismatch endonuclease (patch repair protein)